jgi:hypothetical protein
VRRKRYERVDERTAVHYKRTCLTDEADGETAMSRQTYQVELSGITYSVVAEVESADRSTGTPEQVAISSVKCHGHEIGDDEFEAIVGYLESDVIGQHRERRAAEREAARAMDHADSLYLLACEGW